MSGTRSTSLFLSYVNFSFQVKNPRQSKSIYDKVAESHTPMKGSFGWLTAPPTPCSSVQFSWSRPWPCPLPPPRAPSSAGSAARSSAAPSPPHPPPPPQGTTSRAGPATCAAPSSGSPAARSRSRSSACRAPRQASSSSRPKVPPFPPYSCTTLLLRYASNSELPLDSSDC
jgi:hypothetical protein